MMAATLPAFTEPPYRIRTSLGDTAVVPLADPAADRPADLLRVLRSGHLAGADRPDRLVRDHQRCRVCSSGEASQRPVDLGACVNVDLVHRLADLDALADADDRGQPARSSAFLALALTSSSSSWWYCRRSECPTGTYAQPSLASIVAEISPVYAPLSNGETSWAP